MTPFGASLVTAAQRGQTLNQLAIACGLGNNYFNSRAVHGRRIDIVERLAVAAGMTVGELLSESHVELGDMFKLGNGVSAAALPDPQARHLSERLGLISDLTAHLSVVLRSRAPDPELQRLVTALLHLAQSAGPSPADLAPDTKTKVEQ